MQSQYPYIWNYADDREYLEQAKKDLPPLMISVAITGGGQGKEVNPNQPETPEEQAQQTYEAYEAGACMVHVHARDPERGYAWPSQDPELFRNINKLIREKCPDIIINNTTGAGVNIPKEERIRSIEANPEMASLNCGPLLGKTTFRKRMPPLSGRSEDVVVDAIIPITVGETEYFAQAMLERGIKPELEVYNPGHFHIVDNLIKKDLMKPPYFVQLVMGMQCQSRATLKGFLHLLDGLPRHSLFQVAGITTAQVPMTTLAIMTGGHVRTGLEDVVFYKKKEFATQVKLVQRVVRMAEFFERPIATSTQARQMLGISETPSKY